MRISALLGAAALGLLGLQPAAHADPGIIPTTGCRASVQYNNGGWNDADCQTVGYATTPTHMGIGFTAGSAVVMYFYPKGQPSNVNIVTVQNGGEPRVMHAAGACTIDNGIIGCRAVIPSSHSGLVNAASLANPHINYLHLSR